MVPVIVMSPRIGAPSRAASTPTVRMPPADGPSIGPVTPKSTSTRPGLTPLTMEPTAAAAADAAVHCAPAPCALMSARSIVKSAEPSFVAQIRAGSVPLVPAPSSAHRAGTVISYPLSRATGSRRPSDAVNDAGELHAVAPTNTPAHRATVATMDSMRLMGEVCQ